MPATNPSPDGGGNPVTPEDALALQMRALAYVEADLINHCDNRELLRPTTVQGGRDMVASMSALMICLLIAAAPGQELELLAKLRRHSVRNGGLGYSFGEVA